jgi:hypothetical protein
MDNAARREIMVKIVKKASRYAMKTGLHKMDIPDNVAGGVADQLIIAYDLISKGNKLTPGALSIILFDKVLSILKMGSNDQRYVCGIAIATVGAGFAKMGRAGVAAVATEGALTPVFVMQAAELLASVYEMDGKCGVSDAVVQKVNAATLPAYMWLDREITNALFRGY